MTNTYAFHKTNFFKTQGLNINNRRTSAHQVLSPRLVEEAALFNGGTYIIPRSFAVPPTRDVSPTL